MLYDITQQKTGRHGSIVGYYSVPFTLVGTTLRTRLTTDLVSVFDGDQLVAKHTRVHRFRYRYSTDITHGPSGDSDAHDVPTRDG
ncbi:Mu transposase domain-containing protein [Corynebacterium halotolerans]|uniref:Transposase n=1 Tax=Corynebacterium halotolerans YIM 70093 = DSM 44683 TaxID=1121362 RepID=M1P4Y0_9CORY|nr:hypothetical protein [Corynebacterium halotolerans]AGF71721.1 transposase [Corynebacterium halotolerans YIM 70093 = DSM 44683]